MIVCSLLAFLGGLEGGGECACVWLVVVVFTRASGTPILLRTMPTMVLSTAQPYALLRDVLRDGAVAPSCAHTI